MRRVDLHSPDGEAVAAVVGDVEVGGVLEGDAVEGEVVRVIADDDARDLLGAAGACVLGEVPPVLAEDTSRRRGRR